MLNFLLIMLLLLSWGMNVRAEYKRKSPVISFFFGMFLVAIIPHLYYFFSESIDSSVIREATLFMLLFLLVFLWVRYLFVKLFFNNRKMSNLFDIGSTIFYQDKTAWCYSVLFLLVSVAMVIQGVGIRNLIYGTWWDFIKSNSLFTVAGTYFSYAASGFMILLISAKFKAKILGYTLALVYVFYAVFLLKTRSYVLVIVFPIFVFYVLKGKFEFSRYLYAGFFVAGVSFLFVAARVVRHADSSFSFFSSDAINYESAISDGGETALIRAFYYFIDNAYYSHFGENLTLKRILLFWAPSSIKPDEFSYIMHEAYFGVNMSMSGLSMHPTIFGDAYANANFLGVIMYPLFFAGLYTLLELYASKSNDLFVRASIFGLITINLLTLSRGAVYNSFMFLIIPSVLVFAIGKIRNVKRVKKM